MTSQLSPRASVVMGLFFIGCGVLPILMATGVITPTDAAPVPRWVPICGGLTFIAAGLTVIVDFGVARIGPDGSWHLIRPSRSRRRACSSRFPPSPPSPPSPLSPRPFNPPDAKSKRNDRAITAALTTRASARENRRVFALWRNRSLCTVSVLAKHAWHPD